MKPLPSFGQGVAVALALTLLGYCIALFASLTFAMNLVAFGYLLYLLQGSPITTGRVIATALWLLGTAIALTLEFSQWHLLLWHLTSLWLVRGWCYLDTLAQALVDLALWLFAIAAAATVVTQTANLGLALWTLLLVQATWPLLARGTKRWLRPASDRLDKFAQESNHGQASAFDTSRQAAEAALKQIHSTSL